jgi:hypothetical protein
MDPARNRSTATRVALAAVLPIATVLTGCDGASPQSRPPDSPSAATSASRQASPRSMEGIDGPIQAGAWKVPLYARDYRRLPWALVEVPEGYGSPGGWTVDRGA